MRHGIALAITVTLLTPSVAAAGSQNLQELVAECEACHGPDGVSTEEDVPSLAGRSPAWLREVLEQFYFYERHCPTTTYRSGDRPKTPVNMCGVANTLSAEDRAALADHFGNR